MSIVLRRESIHLLTGGYLAVGVLAIAAIASGDSPLSSESDRIITMGITLLLASIVVALGYRFERLGVTLALVGFGIIATGVSSAYNVLLDPSNPVPSYSCCATRVNGGFPLPWKFTYEYNGGGRYQLLYAYPPAGLDIVAFVLDVVFYVAAGLALIQLGRGLAGEEPQTKPPDPTR